MARLPAIEDISVSLRSSRLIRKQSGIPTCITIRHVNVLPANQILLIDISNEFLTTICSYASKKVALFLCSISAPLHTVFDHPWSVPYKCRVKNMIVICYLNIDLFHTIFIYTTNLIINQWCNKFNSIYIMLPTLMLPKTNE